MVADARSKDRDLISEKMSSSAEEGEIRGWDENFLGSGNSSAGKRGGFHKSLEAFRSALLLVSDGYSESVASYQVIRRWMSNGKSACLNPPLRFTISSRPFI